MRSKWVQRVCMAVASLSLAWPFGQVLADEPVKEVDVVIMLDQSGSISSDLDNPARINDLEIERQVAKQLLNFFQDSAVRPRVAIGSFNNKDDFDPSEAARILPGGELTTDYNKLLPVIDSVTRSQGWTDIASALYVGVSHVLSDPFSKAKKFVVLISDGIPNRPGLGSYEECRVCGCDNAYAAAELIAEQARQYGVEIITIHYDGNGSETKCSGEPADGIDFMKTELSFLPQHAYKGSLQLSEAFDRVACQISCDDNDPCTWDYCDDLSGTCGHTLIETDADGDTVLDCQDSCYGDDAILGTGCVKSVGECSVAGTYQCGSEGAIVCESVETASVALSCSSCMSAASESVIPAGDGASMEFVSEVQRLAKRNLRRLRAVGNGSPDLRRASRRLRRANRAYVREARKFLGGVSRRTSSAVSAQSVPQCGLESSLSCVTPFNDIETGMASLNLERMLRNVREASKLTAEAGYENGRVRQRLRRLRRALPRVVSELQGNSSLCS